MHLVGAQLQHNVDVLLVLEEGMESHDIVVAKRAMDFDFGSKLVCELKVLILAGLKPCP